MVEFFKIGKEERPFLYSWKAVKESESRDLSKAYEIEVFDEIEYHIYLGFKYGSWKHKKESGEKEWNKIDFSLEDIEDWIEDYPEIYLPCLNKIGETQKKIRGQNQNGVTPNRPQRRKAEKAK